MTIARATRHLDTAIIVGLTVASAKTCTKNLAVKHSGADHLIEACGAGDDGIGIALTSGVAGDVVDVVLYSGGGVVPVVVGTGGATRGLYGTPAADGMIDRAVGGGTTARYIHGKFLESGAVGETVAMLVSNFVTVSS